MNELRRPRTEVCISGKRWLRVFSDELLGRSHGVWRSAHGGSAARAAGDGADLDPCVMKIFTRSARDFWTDSKAVIESIRRGGGI